MVGEKLRALRGEVTQAELARRLGITPQAISQYEHGTRTPKDDIKSRYAKLYGKHVIDIFYSQEGD